ncbi:aminotransferase [filamentous cyanobacterium CCT1]|nr:aminotransferase [filamentous cyanobacterium CCT1]PSN79366.1 aminotransferase [filamentous cyanobacterium CCP4]
MLTLSPEEKSIAAAIKQLKDEAGSHSPSLSTLSSKLPDLNIKVDACFLSNPYATDLFLKYLENDLIKGNRLRNVLEFYPSQNRMIAEKLSETLNVSSKRIFVGNGATEIIQAVIHNFTKSTLLINLPTFSSYYEFAKSDIKIVYNKLNKCDGFQLDIEQFVSFVKEKRPDTVVLINPNNPTGVYVRAEEIKFLLEELCDVENLIIDESFIHFSFEDDTFDFKSAAELVESCDNLIVIKSMSKDFGIAGIRIGYALMDENKVNHLLKHGYLWNISGMAEYFLGLYTKEAFYKEYDGVRRQYLKVAQDFFKELSIIEQVKVYPSSANFTLVELIDGSDCDIFCSKLLIKHGVYTRTCKDKVGLEGEFVRISARNSEENAVTINSIKDIFS